MKKFLRQEVKKKKVNSKKMMRESKEEIVVDFSSSFSPLKSESGSNNNNINNNLRQRRESEASTGGVGMGGEYWKTALTNDLNMQREKEKEKESLWEKVKDTLKYDKEKRREGVYVVLVVLVLMLKVYFSKVSNSMTLLASATFSAIHPFSFLVSLLTCSYHKKSVGWEYSYGWERMQVLLSFSSLLSLSILSLYLFFEGVERVLEVEASFVHSEFVFFLSLSSFFLHLVSSSFLLPLPFSLSSSPPSPLSPSREDLLSSSPPKRATASLFLEKSTLQKWFNWNRILRGDISADFVAVLSGLVVKEKGWFFVDNLAGFYIGSPFSFLPFSPLLFFFSFLCVSSFLLFFSCHNSLFYCSKKW